MYINWKMMVLILEFLNPYTTLTIIGVTILLSLTVFLNMVAETMPATSDAVPLLGTLVWPTLVF